MKPADLNSIILTFLIRKIRKKILNLKLPIMFEYQHIETFLQKVTLQIGLKKFFAIEKFKNNTPRIYGISDLNGEEIVETFYRKELQKASQNYMLNGKAMIILLRGLIKKA